MAATFSKLGVGECIGSAIIPISLPKTKIISKPRSSIIVRKYIHTEFGAIKCKAQDDEDLKQRLRTCKNCKKQYDPVENNQRSCFFHSAHFGGETKRKFESVYSGGTLNTAGGGKISQYWHCCGSEDPFDPGCVAAPHCSYDD